MRPYLGILATLILGLGLGACGSSSTDASPQRPSVRNDTGVIAYFPGHKNDRDNDGDHNDDDEGALDYGHAANMADLHDSITLVTRYFAAAAAENGVEVCSLLVPFIAESVPEYEGHNTAVSGKSCATVMSKLFKQNHALLVTKHTTLKIAAIRVEGNKALAILEFPTIPEVREITERRVAGTWYVLELLDGIIE